MKKILTYGTFDILHYGHIRYLKKAKSLGDYLVVGLKTDELAIEHGKKTYYNFSIRKEILEALKYVDEVIEYSSSYQKIEDIKKYKIDTVVISDDSIVLPEESSKFCKIIKFDRTNEISTSKLKKDIMIYKSNEN